jgi:hypothetical protein
MNEDLFTVQEIAILKGVAERTVTYKAKVFGIIPIKKKQGSKSYLFSQHQVYTMFDIKSQKQFKALNPEIIYVTRTIEIYESKLNYLTNL